MTATYSDAMPDNPLRTPPLGKPSFLLRLPKPIRKGVEYGLIFVIVAICFAQMYYTRNAVIEVSNAQAAPIAFLSEWLPDKQEYNAGDTIRFRYDRRARFSVNEAPLLLVNADCFENQATGEVYPGGVIGRIVETAEADRACVSVRKIPDNCASGVYVLDGVMQAQTPRRSRPVGYKSRPFRVIQNTPQ